VDEDRLSYGTHTLPKKFWTIPEGSNLLRDSAYRARREAKKVRHEQNKAVKAEKNRK